MTEIRIASSITLLAVLAAAGACSSRPEAEEQTRATMASTAAPAAEAGPDTVAGTVLETMDAGAYTYVRVKTDRGELWAAASRFKVAVGARVVVPLMMPMPDFHSEALKRDFPLIYFADRIPLEDELVRPALAVSHGQSGAGASVAATGQVDPIAPPAGGLSIAEVWARRTALAGKTVTVRGKVVKVNRAILDRNWVHLQDGTGKADEGTNDLTITTASDVSLGDVITVSGTLAVDKDFTAGYVYKAILEDASLVAK